MKKATILIIGQIGTTYNADNSVNVKGVELQDVVAQVEKAKTDDSEVDSFEFRITSLGGSVPVGKAIAKYISSLENATTVAVDECASMGTEIHLSVPKESRSIVQGTKYSVHNPLLVGVSGNAGELEEMADFIKDKEKAMVKMYTKATGLDKEAVVGLMNQEASLSADECKELGFVSEIIEAEPLKAVAFYENKPKTNNNENNNLMKNIKDIIKAQFATFKKDLNIKGEEEELKTTEIVTAQGKLSIVHVGETLAVGDAVTLEGEESPVGKYEMDNKDTIEVNAEGKISVITKAPKEETQEEIVARLTSENEELKANNETMAADFAEQLEASVNDMKKSIGSNYKPAEAQAAFGKKKPTEEGAHTEAKSRKEKYTTHQR